MKLANRQIKYVLITALFANLSGALSIASASAGTSFNPAISGFSNASANEPSALNVTPNVQTNVLTKTRPLERVVKIDLVRSIDTSDCGNPGLLTSNSATANIARHDGFTIAQQSALTGLLMAAEQSGLEVRITQDHASRHQNTPCS